MSSTPSFAATPIVGTGLAPATADTSLTAPTNATALSWSTAIGASGAKVEEVRLNATATTVAGLVDLFLYDGATYHLVDVITVNAQTLSTTSPPWGTSRAYPNLWIPNGWNLRFAVSVAGLQSIIKVAAMAGNL